LAPENEILSMLEPHFPCHKCAAHTDTHTHMCKQGFFREKKKLKIFAYKLPGEQKRETAKTRQANPKWGRRGLRTHAGLSNRSD